MPVGWLLGMLRRPSAAVVEENVAEEVEEEDTAKRKQGTGGDTLCKSITSSSSASAREEMRNAHRGPAGATPRKPGCKTRTKQQGSLLPVLEGRLYFICVSSSSAFEPKEDELWLTLSKAMLYTPLCADFGPLNLGTTHAWCGKLHALLASPKHQGTKIVVYTSMEASDITNMITLLGAFLCLGMGYSVEDALRPFKSLHHSLIMPFRDATWVKSTFDLHVWDCLSGLQQAVRAGIFKQDIFDPKEYFYYDDPEKGDLHEVVPGKFIAFRGPVRDDGRAGTRGQCGSTLSASSYIDVFKDKDVSTIIRLNSAQYSAAVFKRAGFTHVDLPFEDCGVPPDSIVNTFLTIAEKTRGLIAVHCLAGLGRTGTLIGLYLMKHHRFTAREVIGWLRICRPGSIIGPQQQYLEQQEIRMRTLGVQGCVGLGDLVAAAKVDNARARQEDARKAKKQILQGKIRNLLRESSREAHFDSIEEEEQEQEQEQALSEETPLTGNQPGRLMSPEDAAETVTSRDSRKRRGSFVPAQSLQSQINYDSSGMLTDVVAQSEVMAHMVSQGLLRRDGLRRASVVQTDAWPTDDDKCASNGNSFERIESLDPSDSSVARERLTMEEGDAHYMSKARLPPVEWSSYVRSHYTRQFFDFQNNISRVSTYGGDKNGPENSKVFIACNHRAGWKRGVFASSDCNLQRDVFSSQRKEGRRFSVI